MKSATQTRTGLPGMTFRYRIGRIGRCTPTDGQSSAGGDCNATLALNAAEWRAPGSSAHARSCRHGRCPHPREQCLHLSDCVVWGASSKFARRRAGSARVALYRPHRHAVYARIVVNAQAPDILLWLRTFSRWPYHWRGARSAVFQRPAATSRIRYANGHAGEGGFRHRREISTKQSGALHLLERN